MNIPEEFKDLEIEGDFKKALELAVEGNNMLITGSAGCGKSMMLKILSHPDVIGHYQTVILASTGLASSLIGGQTMHRFFGFPPHPISDDLAKKIVYGIQQNMEKIQLFNNIKTLIIDEISMIKPYHLDCIDKILRLVQNPTLPFGGIQVLLFGDLYQLEPIVSEVEEISYLNDKYNGIAYFFASSAFHRGRFKTIELVKVYRQISDSKYAETLNRIRVGEHKQEDIDLINTRVIPEGDFYEEGDYVYLASRNKKVASVNEVNLEINNNKLHILKAEHKLDFFPQKELGLVEETIKIKLDCQVMLIKNLPDIDKVNGSLGFIEDINGNDEYVKSIKVRFFDDSVHWIGREEFSIFNYKYNASEKSIEANKGASVNQFPIKLAYSFSIHKSQGTTLDRALVDFGSGSFACGQTYVALSRTRRLEDLCLKKPLRNEDIKVNTHIKKLYENI